MKSKSLDYLRKRESLSSQRSKKKLEDTLPEPNPTYSKILKVNEGLRVKYDEILTQNGKLLVEIEQVKAECKRLEDHVNAKNQKIGKLRALHTAYDNDKVIQKYLKFKDWLQRILERVRLK